MFKISITNDLKMHTKWNGSLCCCWNMGKVKGRNCRDLLAPLVFTPVYTPGEFLQKAGVAVCLYIVRRNFGSKPYSTFSWTSERVCWPVVFVGSDHNSQDELLYGVCVITNLWQTLLTLWRQPPFNGVCSWTLNSFYGYFYGGVCVTWK